MFFSMDLSGRLLMKTVKILSETGRRLVNGSAGTCLRLEEELPSRFEEDVRASVAALAQVGIQAPGLSFRCSCHPSNPIKTRCESGHRMAPIACRPVIKCGKCGCTGACPLSVVEYGYQAGKKPATCRSCGKTLPRANVSLSDFLPGKGYGRKKFSSQTVSPALS